MGRSSTGDPAPAGLFAFAATCFVLSCYSAGVPDIHRPPSDPVNMVTGMALFHGGLLQILVGIWEMYRENSVSATVFTSYGAYWMSYAAILIPWFGVSAAYEGVPADTFSNAMAINLTGWAIWTLILLIASLRSPLGILLLFVSAFITFVLLAASAFLTQNIILLRSAGFSGILTGIIACCNALDGLLASMDPFPWWPPKSAQNQDHDNGEKNCSIDVSIVSGTIESPV